MVWEGDRGNPVPYPIRVHFVVLSCGRAEADLLMMRHALAPMHPAHAHGRAATDSERSALELPGDGSAHASSNLPSMLAGGGFKHAGHVAFNQAQNYPLANLYVRMLRQLGVESTTFGTSTGELTEIG